MLARNHWLGFAVVCAALGAFGCSSARDVEVTGNVASGEAASGEVTLDFLDVVDEDEEPKSVATQKLATFGDFTQTVSVSGDKLRVRAILDADHDGACSAGELWAEADASIKDDDTVDPVALTLGHEACPAAKE